jgi:hypothetical protein
VPCAIVLDHLWVIHGDIGRTLLEVLYRVTALGHHRLDQTVRGHDRRRWTVDKLRLEVALSSVLRADLSPAVDRDAARRLV